MFVWACCVFWNRGREHYGTLQAATVWDRTLWNTTGCHSVRQNTMEHYRLPQCETEHYGTLQAATMWDRTLWNTTGCHSVRQNTMEHYRLPKCETEHKHILLKIRGSQNFRLKEHITLTSILLMTFFCSYLLWERESVTITQQHYKIRKLVWT